MKTNQHWRLLDYSLCADKADGVEALHEHKEFQGEYGCPWHEFINDYSDEIDELIQIWWDKLSIEEQKRMFQDVLKEYNNKIEYIKKILKEIDGINILTP